MFGEIGKEVVVEVDGGKEGTPDFPVAILTLAVLGGSAVGLCSGRKMEEAQETFGGRR